MKKNLIYFLLLTIFCINYSCITEDKEISSDAIELQIGDRIPSFNITMNDGKTISDKDLIGQESVIVFFHTGCKDCQKELPIIQRYYENHPYTPVICISRAQEKNSIATFWQANQLTLPYSAQESRNIFELFAYHTIPRVYIIDAEGIIRSIFTDNPLATYGDLVEAIQNAK